MRRGMTLIELLIVMTITLILAGGIFFAYRSVVQQTITQSLVAKNEQDVETMLHQIRKDVASAGFGAPSNMLRAWTNPACNSISAFVGSDSTIGLANCNNSNELYFFSLTAREFRDSGCWWIVNSSGSAVQQSKRWTFEDCPSNPPSPAQALCLDLSTKSQVVPCSTTRPNTIVLPTGGYNFGNFTVRYYLSNTALPKECDRETFNLMREVAGDQPQPVVSCVATFRTRYYDGVQYTTTPPSDLRNLVAVRVCMMVQVGGRTDTLMDPPHTFERCGGITVRPEWREYRWRLVEEDIPLNNIK